MPKAKILVVDDEAPIRQAIQAALEADGYEVQTAENGKEGVMKCRVFRPDLVMLDVRMPVMDGHMASIEIKFDPQLKDTKVVFLTAEASEDSRNTGLGHGAESYITKPFEVNELLARISKVLRLEERAKPEKDEDVMPAAPADSPVIDDAARKKYLEGLKKMFDKK